MIFRILGPLDVAGAPRLGGLQQRALLALLVIRANEAVGRDELIDELWGANPPETAPHAVQVYVSRLRKLLAGAAAEIALDAGGYRLATDPRDVDARAFERMLDEGRRMLQAGNAATAVRALDAALGLWRGGALLDFRHEQFAQPEIARLEGLRLDAMEERFEARLALGAHAELVAELERLIVAEPLRERLSAQLMLALYRSGRQADALAVYRRAAHTLREQLGLAPGPALRELEAAILRQTPALTRAPSRLRLPAAVTPLVGRSAEADTVGELLRRDARLVTLMGPGGIGKTRLALEAAARAAPDFSDGVAFAGLAAVMDAELVVPTIARVLEAPEADGDPLRPSPATSALAGCWSWWTTSSRSSTRAPRSGGCCGHVRSSSCS